MRATVDVACIISGVKQSWAPNGPVTARQNAVSVAVSPPNDKTKINHNYPVSITFEHTIKCVIDKFISLTLTGKTSSENNTFQLIEMSIVSILLGCAIVRLCLYMI